jgi:predicted lipid carrier protein YhbT
VHGYAELHVHGPLREVPPDLRDQALEAVLDVVHRGLLDQGRVTDGQAG